MTGNLIPVPTGDNPSAGRDRAASRGSGGAARSPDPWFAGVVRQFEQPLVLYVARIVPDPDRARDVVQDAFLKLLTEDRGGHRARLQPHLAEWLYTVCRNRAVDVRRKESRMTPMGLVPAESFGQFEPAPGPAAALETRDDATRALSLLDRLPVNQQEVIRLKFQHGLSYRQISSVTQLSVTNVGFLIHTGIASLRKQMTP